MTLEDGVYIVKDGVTYKILPKIEMPFTKRINIMTGEIYYPTNADRIRAMTDEELAELIGDNIDCAICKKDIFYTDVCPRTGEKDCYGVWLDWLKQEADGGGSG